MPSIVERLPSGARVLVVRLRSLGDCVLTTPALSLLHAYRPDLKLGVMVEDRFAQIFEGNPAVAEILPPSKAAASGFRAALAVNFHGGSRSTLLTALSLARWRAGFGHYRQRWVYNLSIPRAQEILGEERTVHTAEHLASAMFYLGVPRTEIPRARLFADRHARRQSYVVIHPLASAETKAWPAARFLEIARWLRDEHGLQPVVIGGPGEDLSAFAELEQMAGAALRDVKSLMSGASLMVGNDSGPAHMAAAFAVPVVALYGSSDPVIWAPWRTRCEVVAAPEGLGSVSVERVRGAVERLLGDPR
jgi:ADP-heptose:LPS heptosyltransferase